MSVKKTTNGHLMLLIQEIVKPIRLIKASPSPLSRREGGVLGIICLLPCLQNKQIVKSANALTCQFVSLSNPSTHQIK